MDKQMVDLYLVMKQKYFAAEHLPYIRERLMQLTDEQFHSINGVELMDPTVMLLVSIFGGSLGIDRFMLGDTGLGVAKFLTAGGCGIFTIIDWFQIQNITKRKNMELFMRGINL